MKKPRKWTEVYPKGTVEGSEEQKFFNALARDPQFIYKTNTTLARESNLSIQRVEEIIDKYHKLGMIFQSETNENSWAYWERDQARIKEQKSLVEIDQDARIEKYKKLAE